MINYKQLLLKYINHVGESEGSTFLLNGHRGAWTDVVFTDEEWAELQKLDEIDYTAFVGHSCSCHEQGRGPCYNCATLGCEVFDFNQVAMPAVGPESPKQFSRGFDYGSLFEDHTKPIFTQPNIIQPDPIGED